RFETALREERDYTGRLIEKTPALICGIAPDGTTKFANPAVEKTTGYRAGELIGKNWWRIFYPGDEFRQVERLFRELEKGNVVDYEMTLTTRSGDRRTVAWSSAHRYDESGAVVEIIGFGVDLTERKKWENALVLAAQKAEESNRLKSTFLSVMSHEFRTPLTVMLGNTPLLTDEKRLPSLPEVADIARDIEHSGKHLLALIDDLLDFSKIEAGKMALHLENVSARDLMKDVVSSVQVIASVKGVPIHTQVDDLRLAGDKVRLKQILFNLFSNSIKFTDKGEIRAVVEKAGDQARFQIKDTGCGIANSDLSFIFDAFRQADASATRGASGAGLGLAITKKLVEMHGGQISAESELGKWTALTFTIPLATQELPYPVENSLSY
ncbi:MAG: PAS domain-containing sensor histidine kinase, partial [Nitrospinae bacterium]|nr:PAS domain-containing sensor histidine kinase [Nitrospinota bacterium]